MTRHYPDLGSTSDWLKYISYVARPIRSTTQIWVVMRRQYGISALVSRKPVVASRNVGYFLKLGWLYLDLRSRLDIVVA